MAGAVQYAESPGKGVTAVNRGHSNQFNGLDGRTEGRKDEMIGVEMRERVDVELAIGNSEKFRLEMKMLTTVAG